MTKIISNNPIVQKWIDGEMDAGGTIHELELYIEELEKKLEQLQPTSPFKDDLE